MRGRGEQEEAAASFQIVGRGSIFCFALHARALVPLCLSVYLRACRACMWCNLTKQQLTQPALPNALTNRPLSLATRRTSPSCRLLRRVNPPAQLSTHHTTQLRPAPQDARLHPRPSSRRRSPRPFPPQGCHGHDNPCRRILLLILRLRDPRPPATPTRTPHAHVHAQHRWPPLPAASLFLLLRACGALLLHHRRL